MWLLTNFEISLSFNKTAIKIGTKMNICIPYIYVDIIIVIIYLNVLLRGTMI